MDKRPTEGLELFEKVQAFREGGEVRRCHGTPHHGEYSNAKHQWGCLTLLLLLHPCPSLTLVKAVAWHDVAERWVGDIPATAKWRHEGLRLGSHEAEDEINTDLGIPGEDLLRPEERVWLKAVDIMDLFLWCKEQLALGNRGVGVITENCRRYIEQRRETFPAPVMKLFDEHVWRRLTD
jgi:5'-deoxynucleotidase YfbR-like HD superfamily hydrolase